MRLLHQKFANQSVQKLTSKMFATIVFNLLQQIVKSPWLNPKSIDQVP